VPERFDLKNKENKWILTSDGKPRNPLAFTAFMGGKRVCLGKTFAETNIRFTIPLIFHYFDFSFANDKEMTAEKETYFLGGRVEWKMPLKITTKNTLVL
jgi:cytochrome P450